MPIIGRVIGGLDFSNYFVALSEVPEDVPMTLDAVKKAGIPVFAYGNFITIAIYFVILAFIIFMMVKVDQQSDGQAAPAAQQPAEPEDVVLLREIRDSLRRA